MLERSRFHIIELREALASYARSDAVTFIQEELDGTFYLRLKFEQPLPETIPCIIYDAVSCLRSTLDYAVYAATIDLTGAAEVEQTKFPVGDTSADAETELRRGGRNVPPELHDTLLQLEPWQNGKGHIIWEFNKVRNKGIHRKLVALAHPQPSDQGFNPGQILVVDELKHLQEWNADHTVLTLLETRGWGEMTYGFRMSVAFDDARFFPKADVVETLSKVGEVVEGIVVGLKRETARILASRP